MIEAIIGSMEERRVPGQRWVSTSQPELGLGILEEAGGGRVTLFFAVPGERKVFSLESAPILRVRFKVGDEVLLRSGRSVVVEEVVEEDGLLTYRAGGEDHLERDLDDAISFSKPDDRLLGGQIDDLRTFNLRVESLFRAARIRESPVRGFLGGRVDLLPHQLSIVREVSSRLAPRVLLADEVGLGKTIEACLILNRLHLTGRAERILILVPEPLVHQWFVELFRRFHYRFALYDEERCRAIPEGNPFLEEQRVICAQEFFLDHPARIPEVMEAGWDLLIVDEAHHLEWSPGGASEDCQLVQALAAETPSVLLLTATPQQLGVEGHFARLQLLDPHRYNDLGAFLEESKDYEEVADVVDMIRSGEQPPVEFFAGRSKRFREGLARIDEPGGREKLVEDLLDSFGTGRVMFRNTRKQLSGFPERKAHLVELTGEDAFAAKVEWLLSFLSDHPGEKVLLIGRTLELVEDLTEALLERVDMKIAQFHEELSLMQRDRNAAYFAEEEGAQLLICSEIGSEGRNFQFAHHLVLFDLPENPEMLEQRIGRLDRIGQSATIHLHVPFVKGDRGERYARYYQEGLNAFEKNLPGAETLVKRLQGIQAATLDDFIAESRKLRAEIELQMERGVDRLLALTSQGRGGIDEFLELIDQWDRDRGFEDWVLRLFDHFGLAVEELSSRSYFLKPGNVITDAFPELPAEGLGVTFQREKALSREEIGLMTADHPMVRDAIDLLLSGEAGNSAFGVWEVPGPKAIILEAYFVIECVAPASLQTDHYLPPLPVRVAVDHLGQDLTSDSGLMKAVLRRGNHRKLLEQPKVTAEIIPAMLKALEVVAGQRKVRSIRKAIETMEEAMGREEARLRDLAEVNPSIDEGDLSELASYRDDLREALGRARLRLDSLRLIYRMPAS